MASNSLIAPPSGGNGRAAGSSTTPCDKSDIEIIDVEWLESYPRVCLGNNLISDWLVWKSSAINKNTNKFIEFIKISLKAMNFPCLDYGDKPAVYFIRQSPAQHNKRIKIKVVLKTKCGAMLPSTALTEKVNLIISFGNKEFISNDFYLPAHNVEDTVIIEGDVDCISWLKSPIFSLKYKNNGAIVTKNNITKKTIPLEAFVLYDEPADFYTNGVWVEALWFLFNHTKIDGDQDITLSAGKITYYCNSQHGMKYETSLGESKFTEFEQNLVKFHLLQYMTKKVFFIPKKTVNCVDQGCAVRTLGGAIGLYIEPVQMKPFGYIDVINLVGIGRCNNPFINLNHQAYSNEKEFTGLIDKDGKKKTAFGMHHFASLAGTTHDKWNKKESKILDACALPILANGDLDKTLYSLEEYLPKSIDMPLDNLGKLGITEVDLSGNISAYYNKIITNNSGNVNDYTGIIFGGTIQYNNLELIYEF